MAAPKNNTNATKQGNGIQVNFYLSAEDVAAIRRTLQQNEQDASDKAIRAYAREQSKNGIWHAIKEELPPIIL